MNDRSEQNSVGVVETRIARIELPPGGFKLENGGVLSELEVAYETYGVLAEARDNVIFICHALSGDAHVAGRREAASREGAGELEGQSGVGWWDEMVGPGKGIDTRFYCVICANILGGCSGTTGPASVNPATGRPYGSAFPAITVGDVVETHCLLLQHLGIGRLAAVAGGSFGGMQVLEWAIRYPGMIDHCICIASAAGLSAQALAFDVVGRNAITSDPDWQGGDYYGSGRSPGRGLSQARKIGHITYLSPGMMAKKFGRQRNSADEPHNLEPTGFKTTFQVESYLEHQGEKFLRRFDANSYLQIARAMDEYDLVERFGSLEAAFRPIRAKMLVVALSEDWLFPPGQSIEIASALLRAGRQVSFCRLQAPHGHDAFLVDIEHLAEAIRAFLPWVAGRRDAERRAEDADAEAGGGEVRGREGHASRCRLSIEGCRCSENLPAEGEDAGAGAAGRREFQIIAGMIREGIRVLDIGSGNGQLLSMLARTRRTEGLGVDIDIRHVIEVLDRGHDVFQADIDAGLAMIPDGLYDYAILSETLQVVHRPRFVLQEMLRVAREGIVSFPNFGRLEHRWRLWLKGRMPKGHSLPFEWYETPNIHLFTLRDFVDLCRRDGIRILELVCLPGGRLDRGLLRAGFCNLGADRVLVKIARAAGKTEGSTGSVAEPRKQ